MAIEFNLPIESISPSIEAKNAFRQFAQTKVIFFDRTEDCDRFIDKWWFKRYGHSTLKERSVGPGQVLTKDINGPRLNDQTLDDFAIVINRPSFIIDGEDFSDLIPLVIEHEIMELWFMCKKGFLPIDTHSLAIIEETKMAVKIGKEERRVRFQTLLQSGQVNQDSGLMRRVIDRMSMNGMK
jgi:hypothetical protein